MTIETSEQRAARLLSRAQRTSLWATVALGLAIVSLASSIVNTVHTAIEASDCPDLRTVFSYVQLPGCGPTDDVEAVRLTKSPGERPRLVYSCAVDEPGTVRIESE